MRAFIIIDGKISACAYHGPKVMAYRRAEFPIVDSSSFTYTRRERRRIARRGTRGRRGARRVPAMRCAIQLIDTEFTALAHFYRSRGGEQVVLYLPRTERPTPHHQHLLVEACRRIGMAL